MKPDLAMLEAEAQLGPGVDKQAWKKQQRMIRNRESAALSRKRKRDRIESLEEQVCVVSEGKRDGSCLVSLATSSRFFGGDRKKKLNCCCCTYRLPPYVVPYSCVIGGFRYFVSRSSRAAVTYG